MSRDRVLVVHPRLWDKGGGDLVAAWILEALGDVADRTLLTWARPRLQAVDRAYATALDENAPQVVRPSRPVRWLVDALPTRCEYLRLQVLAKTARRLLGGDRFALGVSTNNELDLGRPGLQYVHFPAGEPQRPEHELAWFHRIPGFLSLYRSLARSLAPRGAEGIQRNLTLVNSAWTGQRVRALYGVEPVVVPPPVPGTFPQVPWQDREDRFSCIGRISPEKRIEEVVGIVGDLRDRGHDVGLDLVGAPDDRAYAREISSLVAKRPWVSVFQDLSRRNLLALLGRNRYGLHAMVDEHFGIAVAEMQRAGSIVFAPASGGPAEILGRDPHLLFTDRADAVRKIRRALLDREHRSAVRAGIRARRETFSATRFAAEIRRVVGELLSGRVER